MSYRTISDFNNVSEKTTDTSVDNSFISINKSLENRNTLLSDNTIAVIYNYAPWCGPCKKLAPLYNELGRKYSKQGDCVLIKEDIENEIDESTLKYIRGIPCFHFYTNSVLDHSKTITGADITKVDETLKSMLVNHQT